MDTREQARRAAQAAKAALTTAEVGDYDEVGLEAGWDFAEAYLNASVEEVRQEAERQRRVRQMGEGFRLGFISAALQGVEGMIR